MFVSTRLQTVLHHSSCHLRAQAAVASHRQTITNLSQPMPAANRAPPRFCASSLPAGLFVGYLESADTEESVDSFHISNDFICDLAYTAIHFEWDMIYLKNKLMISDCRI
jgi:hypothetical protein